MNILIVEDEVIIAEDIRRILLSLDHKVVGMAINYTQAVAMMDHHLIDLALIDIVLSGSKTGIDVASEIKKNHQFPFIFLTSHADPATVKMAKEIQPAGYLLKPFSRDDIFTTIEIVIGKTSGRMSPTSQLALLSDREQEVFASLMEGHTDHEISEQLFISLNTVKTHLKSIYKKFGVKNRLEAVTVGTR